MKCCKTKQKPIMHQLLVSCCKPFIVTWSESFYYVYQHKTFDGAKEKCEREEDRVSYMTTIMKASLE